MGTKLINTSDMGFVDMAQTLYDCSAFTFIGIAIESDTLHQINDCMVGAGLNYVDEFYTYTGNDMNKLYDLHGDNRYPNDLHFLSFKNDNQDIGKLAMFKLRIGARWFDDIVDNNARNNHE